MQFLTLLLTLLPAASVIAGQAMSDDFTTPWTGAVGPVPRFECTCDCGDAETSKNITKELCNQAITLGRKKEIRLMEDGSCAFWGLDVQMFPDELGNAWGKEICAEKGCKVASTCDYVTCSGIEKKKWAPPAPVEKEEEEGKDDE
ncbi:hypothetical protein ABW20_dc0100614 [Dactylellina cionopaga]|nr:hypothetical protein ABW20_dc0100614 [Dactylellina cionopaga]